MMLQCPFSETICLSTKPRNASKVRTLHVENLTLESSRNSLYFTIINNFAFHKFSAEMHSPAVREEFTLCTYIFMITMLMS